MEFRPKDGTTFKALAQNILQFINDDSEAVLDGGKHIILLENGSGIQLKPLLSGTFTIFPAKRVDDNYWYTSDHIGLGGILYIDENGGLSDSSLRVIRVVAMRAWKKGA